MYTLFLFPFLRPELIHAGCFIILKFFFKDSVGSGEFKKRLEPGRTLRERNLLTITLREGVGRKMSGDSAELASLERLCFTS